MQITIEGAKRAPRWETLQNVIRDVCADESARLLSTFRQTPGICYADPGRYRVEFVGLRCGKVVVDLQIHERERGEDRG